MLQVNEEMFNEIVDRRNPIVALVSAEWCAPCRTLKPLLKKIEESYANQIKFYGIDSDSCVNLCSDLGITGIPTLLFISEAQVKSRLIGVSSEIKIRENIDEILK